MSVGKRSSINSQYGVANHRLSWRALLQRHAGRAAALLPSVARGRIMSQLDSVNRLSGISFICRIFVTQE
jgi:hypothetical protein